MAIADASMVRGIRGRRLPAWSRRVAALLALWAMLFQGALAAFHHHDHIGHDRVTVGATARPAVPAGDNDDDDDDDGCAVCQLLLALHALAPPVAGGGVSAPVAIALRLTQSTPRPPRHSRRRRRRQPRGPPASP